MNGCRQIHGGCKCQECGRLYKIDFLIPDDLWEEIKPSGKSVGAGLLCGICIIKAIEKLIDDYGAFEIFKIA